MLDLNTIETSSLAELHVFICLPHIACYVQVVVKLWVMN